MDKFTQAVQILNKTGQDGWLTVCDENSDVHAPFMLGVKAHSRHYVYVGRNGTKAVLSNEMEAPMLQKSLDRMGIDIKVQEFSQLEEIPSMLNQIMGGAENIALNFGEQIYTPYTSSFADYIRTGDYLALVDAFPKKKFTSAASLIEDLRSVKTAQELKSLREVCKVTMEILEDLPNWVHVGMTEKELKAKLEYEYMKLGEPSFESIIGSGPNGADPHHNSSEKKIENGCLLVDSGLFMNQMCSDITWTFWVGSEPPEEFTRAYDALLQSKIEANKYYLDGQPNYLPAVKCREKLTELGYDHEKLYIHGLGHSMGYLVHDVGMRISWRVPKDPRLKENMVYSNEPGLYWQGKYGIRLEDDVIIGKTQAEQVTQCPKDPIVI